MRDFIYRWLPVIFGCHCRDDRSFHYKGKKFPICARCTGELCGIIVCIFIFPFWQISWQTALIIMIPMIIDGFYQLLTKYESNNAKRFITGFLFGYALYALFAITTWAAFEYGYNLSAKIKHSL